VSSVALTLIPDSETLGDAYEYLKKMYPVDTTGGRRYNRKISNRKTRKNKKRRTKKLKYGKRRFTQHKKRSMTKRR